MLRRCKFLYQEKSQLFKKKRYLINGASCISLKSIFLLYPITLAPNGMKESLAILKNYFPNGIPTIVMHHMKPSIRFPSAISQPKNRIQIKFTRNENIPFPYTISFPKGQNASDANLKHCSPTGIPTIVIHHMHPAKIHASPPSNPPNINQRIFPKVFITASLLSPFFYYSLEVSPEPSKAFFQKTVQIFHRLLLSVSSVP